MSFRESSAAAVFQYLASASEAGAGADDTVVRVGVAVGLGLLPRVREKRRECNLLPGLLREELMVLSTGTTVFLSRDEGRHLLQRTEKLLLLLLLLAGVVAGFLWWSGVGWCLYGNASSSDAFFGSVSPSSCTAISGTCSQTNIKALSSVTTRKKLRGTAYMVTYWSEDRGARRRRLAGTRRGGRGRRRGHGGALDSIES
ncbi:uncharacterized protein M6B38_265385 [Iris pallida]|uniref:Uncharacterized protein n=1 Tax=Iris pallida TaxID=29817 RepID=A0AAX6IB92_IRIPA|nr:uncharacterized protein M6B38_267715 [Iris pallida]KAJ6850281.1 uncharacterized protein M6B38_265385 [Iris pallida]